MKKLNAVLSIVFIAAINSAFANTPSDASLEELSKVAPYEQAFMDIAFSGLQLSGEELAYGLANDSKLSEKQRTDALKVYETYANNLIKTVNTPAKKAELKKAYTNAAKQTYTQAEIDALLAFANNKVLQDALKKQDIVLDKYIGSVEKSTMDAIEKYQKANLTKMQDNIKRITNQ